MGIRPNSGGNIVSFPLGSIYAKIQGTSYFYMCGDNPLIFMIEINYAESGRTFPKNASSIPASSPRTSNRPFPKLTPYQTAWFPKLIILMFLMALGFAANVMISLIFSTDWLAVDVVFLILFYCRVIGGYILVLIVSSLYVLHFSLTACRHGLMGGNSVFKSSTRRGS